MANNLPSDRQAQIIAALAECNSIRSIERQTGVHRDTIMRLGVRVGTGCQALLDTKMRGLDCQRIEIDELWGFIRMFATLIGKRGRRKLPFRCLLEH